MRQVRNAIFYHIQTLDQPSLKSPWNVADKKVIGEKLNPYSYVLEHVIPEIPDKVTWLEQSLGHFYKCTREAVFEEVRSYKFMNYPSRRHCLWVIEDNQESIDYWWNHFKSNSRHPDKLRLLKLRLSGDVFKTSQSYLSATLTSVSEIREQALKYWMAQNVEEDSEILFRGTLEVIEIVK